MYEIIVPFHNLAIVEGRVNDWRTGGSVERLRSVGLRFGACEKLKLRC
jgi:hypothetical protein